MFHRVASVVVVALVGSIIVGCAPSVVFPEIVVRSISIEHGPAPYKTLVGVVENVSSYDHAEVQLRVLLYDSAGQIVGDVTVPVGVLAAKSSTKFKRLFTVARAEVAQVVSLTSRRSL